MSVPKQWLSYWKKSLLDSMKAEIDLEKYKIKIQIPDFSASSDKLTNHKEVNLFIDAQEQRINKRKHLNPTDPEWLHLEEVPVLISPFRLNPLLQRQSFVRERKSIYPFWYPALLNRSGKLNIPSEILPFIPRCYLTPIVDEKIEYIIGDTTIMDRACAVGEIRFDNYVAYIEHISHIFEQVAGSDMTIYSHQDFKTDYTAHIIVPDEMIGATQYLIELYQNVSLVDGLPPLLCKLISLDQNTPQLPLEVQDWLYINAKHLGQMKPAFPLSYSQRKSLYTLLANTNEKIMAVNGPPGTGKTTLLQSVVANIMVQSALSEKPSVILACSSTNQAVTNIIESFTKKEDNEPEIRWLPNMKGYATYLPASTAPDESLQNINYMKPGGDGLFSQLETPEYLKKAQFVYLQQASAFFGKQLPSIEATIQLLHNRIVSAQHVLQEAQILWQKCLEVYKEFELNYLPKLSVPKSYKTEDSLISEALLEEDITLMEGLTEKVLDYFRDEGLLRKIGCWLGINSAIRNRRAELNIFFRRSNILSEIFPLKITGSADILPIINDLIILLKKIKQHICHWKLWQHNLELIYPEQVNKKTDFFQHTPSGNSTGFYDMLDTTVRYRTFIDAVHYWEGRWIKETKNLLALPDKEQTRRGEEACKARWYRRAMLSPCFVSTFYMAPRFFNYVRYLGKDGNGKDIFGNPPLTNFINCLIVDEAGQVPPEVGAGVFALAKKAVVVGDIKQIEPVWNILPKVDLGNLEKEGLIKRDEKIAEEIYEPKGFLSSSGSIMQMAQDACSFAEKGCAERGIMLVEHRRCYNQIIEYCNELAYHGLLRPLRGPANETNLFPPMYCIHVDGHSNKNKDRYNEFECDAICKWLTEQKAIIEAKYINGKDYKCIEDIIGIITPFVGQKNKLKQALRKAGFNAERFKLGTVHALQGAERPIVLFSTVYGPGEVGTMFFDFGNKPNMLNVAVSRAKDSFIVFANTKIFNSRANTPSGILARHLVFEYKN